MTDQLYGAAVRVIDRCILALAGMALLLMMLHISIDVVSNLLFGAPVPLTNATVTQYYMIAVAFLPLAAGEYRGAHIRVDLVVNHLPAVLRRWLDHLVQALCFAVYVALAIQALAAEPLRVCADPDNLPFSKAEGAEHGLYIDLAELVAQKLGSSKVDYNC